MLADAREFIRSRSVAGDAARPGDPDHRGVDQSGGRWACAMRWIEDEAVVSAEVCIFSFARRGGRYPAWAHTVAVGAERRLRCDARAGVAPRNSLHSLRSLRSNNRGESDERSALRAPTPTLRFSPPTSRPPRAPPTALQRSWCSTTKATVVPAKPWVGVRRQRHMRRRGAQGSWPRAPARSCSDSSRLFERIANAVSEASFATGHETEHRREPFAQRRAAAFERRRIPARCCCSRSTVRADRRGIA